MGEAGILELTPELFFCSFVLVALSSFDFLCSACLLVVFLPLASAACCSGLGSGSYLLDAGDLMPFDGGFSTVLVTTPELFVFAPLFG